MIKKIKRESMKRGKANNSEFFTFYKRERKKKFSLIWMGKKKMNLSLEILVKYHQDYK